MPCDTSTTLTQYQKQAQSAALKRLQTLLAAGSVKVKIGAQGAVAFDGWAERGGLSDVCAYRRLLAANSPELRRAVMRAEAISGRKIDGKTVAAGVHSHDGGLTWNAGH